MADTSIAITAGTGTAIDTRTEATNGNHRQVVVLGDPSTNAGVAPVDATAGLKVNLGADNDVTVTGTVDLGATDNAVLDSIVTNTADVATQTTLAALNAKLVTGTDIGDVTINNGTGVNAVNIQDGGNTITVDGTVTANLSATDNAVLDAIAASVAGTLTVGSHAVTNAGTFAVQSTLQAGTAYAGKVRLTDGTTDTDVLDLTNSNPLAVALVDGNGDQITSIGGGTEYTEDAAAAANPVGKALTLIRDDARGGSLTTADGDNVAARGTNAGELYVKHVDAIPITDNSGSLTVDGTVAATQSGTWNITNVSGTVSLPTGASTAAKQPALGTAGTASADVITVQGIASMTPLLVDGSAVTQPVSGTVSITANSAVNIAQMNGVTTTMGNGASGTGVQRVTIANDSTGVLATVSTVTTVSTLTGSGVAHDGADSGNPHKMGARATNVDISAVSATNDRTDLVATLTGKLIVQPYSNPENFVSGAITTAMTGTTSTSLIAAPAAGLRNYITQVTVSNAHATVGTDMILQDGSGGTTLYTIPAAAVYGGAAISFPVPLRQPTTATALYIANVTTGASTKASASGYKAA